MFRLVTGFIRPRQTTTHPKTPSFVPSVSVIARFIRMTTRIAGSDAQGHGSYLRTFQELKRLALNALLKRVGIAPTSVALAQHGAHGQSTIQGHFRPVITGTQYSDQILMGEEVDANASIARIEAEKGVVIISTLLKNAAKPKASGFYVLQRYNSLGKPAPLTASEAQSLTTQLSHTYSPATNAYPLPSSQIPSEVKGKEIPLTEDESTVALSQVGHNNLIDFNRFFDLLHTYCYEKGLMENTGEGFETKKGKPVMAKSQVYLYQPLRAEEKFRVFAYIERNEGGNAFEKGRYTWVGTVTNQQGDICAIARCEHVLLDINNRPATQVDPRFISRLNEYAVSKNDEYGNLTDKSLMPHAKHIRFELNKNGVAYITINVTGKPQNVLTAELFQELEKAIEFAEDLGVRAVVFQSGREGGFVVGADVAEFHKKSADDIREFSTRAQRVLNRIAASPVTTFSIINDYALGGGLELAMATMFRLATNSAKVGQVETLLGAVPAFDGHWRLKRIVGTKEAARLIANGEMINAEEAVKIGLLDAIITTNQDITAFIEKACKGESKHRIHPETSGTNNNIINETKLRVKNIYQLQIEKINALEKSNRVQSQQAANIKQWLSAVFTARTQALDVLNEQGKTPDPDVKSQIETNAFVQLVASKDTQFATELWLLRKTAFKEEHAVIKTELMDAGLFYLQQEDTPKLTNKLAW